MRAACDGVALRLDQSLGFQLPMAMAEFLSLGPTWEHSVSRG